MARTRPTPRPTPPPEPESLGEAQAPRYNPAEHTDPDQDVYLELYCRCGSIRRQRDPVQLVRETVADWWALHGSADGHGPASNAEAVAEPEARREAAHRAAGNRGY